jgi:ectoine hydroxylase-related dioxygenase (phytanoyl-CoA dioxygenase family)
MDIAEEYLETEEVRIRNCLAFYHPENPFPPANSQNWHRDTEDTKILKAFVYYNDVAEDNGCLWYVKNSKHNSKNDSIWPNVGKAKHGYLDLEATMKIPYNDIVKLEGKSGTICFFDANGFHKGGNVKRGYRISTHCCYLRSDAPHIINGILPTFDYNDKVNIIDKSSENYRQLPSRQKKVLQ